MTLRSLAMAALLVPGGTACAQWAFAAGPARVALVELFTSEGCSSCPPAEQWLADRRGDAGLWRDFVPLAWHVTDWDDLGWHDRYARRVFTDRQYAYAHLWGSESVYTPCFVRNGREWRPGPAAGGGEQAGFLRARWDLENGVIEAEFDPAAAAAGLNLAAHAAVLGGGIVSPIGAGENRGRALGHEFVVLAVADAALAREADTFRGRLRLRVPPDRTITRRALAVWVTRRGDLVPLQAAGGWLAP